jgi:hypothetical protein
MADVNTVTLPLIQLLLRHSQHPLPMSVQSPTEYCKNRDNYDNCSPFFLGNYLMFLDHPKKEDVNGNVSRLRHDFWTRSIGSEVSFDTKKQPSSLYGILWLEICEVKFSRAVPSTVFLFSDVPKQQSKLKIHLSHRIFCAVHFWYKLSVICRWNSAT